MAVYVTYSDEDDVEFPAKVIEHATNDLTGEWTEIGAESPGKYTRSALDYSTDLVVTSSDKIYISFRDGENNDRLQAKTMHPLTTYYSPLTIHHPLFTRRYSLGAQCSTHCTLHTRASRHCMALSTRRKRSDYCSLRTMHYTSTQEE